MAERDSRVRARVFLHQDRRDRLAHDIRAPADNDVLPGRRVAAAVQQLHDPGRRGGPRARLAPQQAAEAHRRHAVGVLLRVDRVDDRVLVELLRQGELHQDAVEAPVLVEVEDARQEHLLVRVLR